MLKQVFNRKELSKILTASDIQKWNLLSLHGNLENIITNTVKYWDNHNLQLSPLYTGLVKRKTIFKPSRAEDDFAIRLVDRFIRRVYKVRQSDRGRIIRQLVSLLKDSGDYQIIRLDIKNCYESIKLKSLIEKIEDDLILAPKCIKLLKNINNNLITNYNTDGLPRGLSISPTLAELYLEELDKKIAAHPNVIYSARYIDDIVIFTPKDKKDSTKNNILSFINELSLQINTNSNKYYDSNTQDAEFTYLGYFIKVSPQDGKPNKVEVTISPQKINKIKSRITKSLIDHKIQSDIQLLKQRLEYISMLKVVKKGENGDLLAGIAHNYQLVTDNFCSLRKIDGFISHQLTASRFNLTTQEKAKLKKISIYSNVKNKKIGNFSKSKTLKIMRVWKNA